MDVKWVKAIQQDMKSNNLSLNETVDVAQDRPLWRLMSTFGATLLVVWCLPEMRQRKMDVGHNRAKGSCHFYWESEIS